MKALFKQLLCGTVLVASAAAAMAADPFPSKPVRIVVNSSAGALLDAMTRAVAEKIADNLGKPVIVENRPGADGLIGIRYVKGMPADGYTLLSSANTVALAPALKLEPGYDILKDFAGIGMTLRAPLLMVGPPSQPAKTLAEFIARAKANPDAMTYASAGVGTSTHMAAALFIHQAGIKMLHVPYKGNAAAMPDLLGGRVNTLFDGGNTSGPYIKERKLRAFGITSSERSAAFPDIPTLAEQGLPNYSFVLYHGLVVPADTPKEVVQRLSQALRSALANETVREIFSRNGAQTGNTSPDEFTEFLKQDYLRTVKVVSDLGLTKE